MQNTAFVLDRMDELDKLGIADVAPWKNATQQQVQIAGLQVDIGELSATVCWMEQQRGDYCLK